MTDAGEPKGTRAVSRDGTEIAYWTTGAGPPLLLVHGMTGDHTRWRPLLPYLAPHAAVSVMDRRGRGESGDGPHYDVVREFEDVAAVVDAIAETSGQAVDVYGHSFGGLCAFGAATLTPNVRRLVLYEGWPAPDPSVLSLPPGLEEQLDALLAQGEHEAVVETFFRAVLMMPEDDFNAFRAQPSWQNRIDAAGTITRESRAELASPLDSEQAAKITVPVLLLSGGDSLEYFKNDVVTVAAALPDARVVFMPGQQHLADVLAPELFAEHVVTFLRDGC